ncbi:hypothetical protein [Paraglaciecola sp. 20A4]|uniref:hypothetical protein n=1 Tax=Paraglaciecola sp. 20A4 TaxID=2687288 RepID=UPI00140D26A9|nr:hypothetical protein [Paraglaciecola sp. 20A4]
MKKYLTLLILVAAPFVHTIAAAEGIIVVANTTDNSIQLNRQQVRNLFMGGVIPYDLTAVSLPPDNRTRVLFNTKVVGLTEARIQSYWAQMRFTGRKRAPREVNNESLLLDYLKESKGAVGYLPASATLPKELTVIYKID